MLLVLIVEDEFLIVDELRAVLGEEGYRTAAVATAAQADEVMRSNVPDAALVDLRLRDGMTGPDIARSLHELGVPVILLSGELKGHDDIPAIARLAKPASRTSILREVRRAVGRTNTSLR